VAPRDTTLALEVAYLDPERRLPVLLPVSRAA
jgi:hypothetical protein